MAEAPVLRLSLFGDVHGGQDLDARNHGRCRVQRVRTDFDHPSVDPQSHAKAIGFRFEMNIAGAAVDRFVQNAVQLLHDIDAGGRRGRDGRRDRGGGAHAGTLFTGAAVHLVDDLDNLITWTDHILHGSLETSRDGRHDRRVDRVCDGHHQLTGDLSEEQAILLPGDVFRQRQDPGTGSLSPRQIEIPKPAQVRIDVGDVDLADDIVPLKHLDDGQTHQLRLTPHRRQAHGRQRTVIE